MTREEIEKKIAEMEAGIAELKEEFEKTEDTNPDVFIPKYGDKYWSIYSDGRTSFKLWEDAIMDKDRFAVGNAFCTKEEAEFEVERRKVIWELKQFAIPKGKRLKNEHCPWTIGFNLDANTFDTLVFIAATGNIKQGEIYFATKEMAEKAVKAVGKDRIKKYYLCVEED